MAGTPSGTRSVRCDATTSSEKSHHVQVYIYIYINIFEWRARTERSVAFSGQHIGHMWCGVHSHSLCRRNVIEFSMRAFTTPGYATGETTDSRLHVRPDIKRYAPHTQRLCRLMFWWTSSPSSARAREQRKTQGPPSCFTYAISTGEFLWVLIFICMRVSVCMSVPRETWKLTNMLMKHEQRNCAIDSHCFIFRLCVFV